MTLGRLAAVLSGGLMRLTNRPVVDTTGVDGEFDIVLDARYPVATPADDPFADAPSIFSEIQRLGLRLESGRLPIEYLVVESVNKTPTEN